jgi:IS5 family transposase
LTQAIVIDEKHRLVRMTEEIDWTELKELVEAIRREKLTSEAGRPPRLRALIGAVLLRATRHTSYRETEDYIRYYAPARYLCGLTETDWTPDANTIQDFEQLLGEQGVKKLNEYVVKWAVDEKLADPKVMVADTTAQEAAIPYPNEMGLMAAFMTAVVAASKRVGGALKGFAQGVAGLWQKGKRKLREYRLFTKEATQAAKKRMNAEMADLVEKAQKQLARALEAGKAQKDRLVKYGKVAWATLQKMHATMQRLLPQIRSWIRTGRVAKNKIISLSIPELYSIVRGKVGKAVEFGLKWGIARLRGGFLLATMARTKGEVEDARFATRAVEDHIALFGKPPKGYAYDRGGWSKENVVALKELGVKQVGLAPRGKARWEVSGRVKETLVNERAQVEGGIGCVKHWKYRFNKPAAKSADTMGVAGQRAVLGFNLNKLVRGLAARQKVELVG